jgi:cbb3-type cytochrome oxidase maturation protein
MEALFVLLTVSLVLGLVFLGAFLWATHRGQFDDAQTPAWRILNEDEPLPETKTRQP